MSKALPPKARAPAGASLLLALALVALPAHARQKTPERAQPMKLRLTLGETVLTATLHDHAAARDFAALLPLTLTLTDYAASEKSSDLPRKLSTQGVSSGSGGKAGALAYYAPWGNLALFHKDFGPASGLITLGTLDGGVEALRKPGPLQVRFERAE